MNWNRFVILNGFSFVLLNNIAGKNDKAVMRNKN